MSHVNSQGPTQPTLWDETENGKRGSMIEGKRKNIGKMKKMRCA